MEDNKVLELLVQAVKNIDEKIDGLKEDMNTRFDETNRRIDNLQDEMNTRLEIVDKRMHLLQSDINRQFKEVRQDIKNIKSREKHILDIAMQG